MSETKTLLMRGSDGEVRRVKRILCGDEGHLYYGDGSEPCHYCGARVGQPHVLESACDHEECPLCHGQLLGCGCETADFFVEVRGRAAGARRNGKWVGNGFSEAEAEADADRRFFEAGVRALEKYLAEERRKAQQCEENEAKLAAVVGDGPRLATQDLAAARWTAIQSNIEKAEGLLEEQRRKVAEAEQRIAEDRPRSFRRFQEAEASLLGAAVS